MTAPPRELTKEEIDWMLEGLEINSTVKAKSVPTSKLVELFNSRFALEATKKETAELKDRLRSYEHECETIQEMKIKLAETDAALEAAQNEIATLERRLMKVLIAIENHADAGNIENFNALESAIDEANSAD